MVSQSLYYMGLHDLKNHTCWSSVIECLVSICEALGSISSTTHKHTKIIPGVLVSVEYFLLCNKLLKTSSIK
jgi:hypothetical protein